MELIHPALDILEFYALHRIPELELAAIEEHLLVCSECQDRVSSLDYYHANLKEVLRQAEVQIHATEDGLIYNWTDSRERAGLAGGDLCKQLEIR